MFRSIVVPVDPAQPSSWRFSLPQALSMMTEGKSKLAVVAVVPDIKLLLRGVQMASEMSAVVRSAHSQLAVVVQKAAPGREVEVLVRTGSICHEILTVSKERKADLIVMESHRPEMVDYLIGPNSSYVARHASCSVLVLRRALSKR